MKMKLNNRRGISLIVLVITIVVMIILASAVILTVKSGDIIGKANEAKEKSEIANIREYSSLCYTEYLIDKTQQKIGKDVSAEDYIKDKLRSKGISEETLKLVKITNGGKIITYNMPIVPEGFVKSDIETEDDVMEGLVIYEGTASVKNDSDAATTRNQYVWVPVPDITEFVRNDGYSEGVPQEFVSSRTATEPYSYNTLITEVNDLTGEYAEYAKMKASVEKYGGFYIARYEAGTSVKRAKKVGTSADILSQKEKYPYNYVGWGPDMKTVTGDVVYNGNQGEGAVKLARSVYPESSNKEVVSTLCYGVQWDAIVDFVKNIENPNVVGKKYIEESTGMGWYKTDRTNNDEHKTGIDLNIDTNSDGTYDLFATNKVKNIYDLAGNLEEWTMEASEGNTRIRRGGNIRWNDAIVYPMSARIRLIPNQSEHDYSGFRVALYLK